jgi:beta-mannosidase
MTLLTKQSLAGAWQFRQAGGGEWLPAIVPGGVHTDLLAAGRIADPFAGDEELRVQWVAEQDWEYRRVFTVDSALAAQARVALVCDGLDTLAEVQLNGQPVGTAENMFRPYSWDVLEILQPGENELRILFRSPVRSARARQAARLLPDVNNPLPGGPYLRKAPSHFGWDWGPRLPPIGIWRDIRLEGYSIARLADVELRQLHHGGRVILRAAAGVWRVADTPVRLSVQLTAPDGRVQTAESALNEAQGVVAFAVEDPQLWWPNGYGGQPLYRVDVGLLVEETLLDEWTYQVGLRTVELRRERDEWGESFTFVVNGVPIFAKGTNWIPADSFPTRITPAQLEHLLGSAAAAHHNMVRVWGGGYYEDEYFYDLCDRLGLLVWQDFMFACAGYPLDEAAFVENVRGEVVANVRRLRHRACLALWCGNNEIEVAWYSWGWNTPENADLIRAYAQFFHHTLPAWIADVDPDSPYWPSSPSSGPFFADPDGNRAGDIHQWKVWHKNEPFSHYRETPARFVSEFGFQSLPALPTVATFAAPADWNITSYIMEHHQRSPVGNEKIIYYMLDHFRLPKDFAALVYLSQLLQLEAMRTGVEFWRRHPATSGALYWQLNDCWPVISWASIDYTGRWKALHYASRRFFNPLLLAIEDAGTRMGIFVTNDRLTSWTGAVRWSLETLRGERLAGGEEQISIDPLTTAPVQRLDFGEDITAANRRQVILVCDLRQDGEPLQTAIATFAPTKHLALEDPRLSVEVAAAEGELTVQLRAESLARFVELTFDGADVVFSDNYFDLPAGRTRRVTCPLPHGWTPEQARTTLRVRSVFDSF